MILQDGAGLKLYGICHDIGESDHTGLQSGRAAPSAMASWPTV